MTQYLMTTPQENNADAKKVRAEERPTDHEAATEMARSKAQLARLKRDYRDRSGCERPLPRSVDLAYRRTIAAQESKINE